MCCLGAAATCSGRHRGRSSGTFRGCHHRDRRRRRDRGRVLDRRSLRDRRRRVLVRSGLDGRRRAPHRRCQPRGDQRDEDVPFERVAEARPEDHVRVGIGSLADHLGGLADLAQSEVWWAGDVEEDPPGAIDAGLQQRAGDRLTRRVGGAVLAGPAAQADERRTGVLHHGPDIGKVEIDQAGCGDEVDDPLDRLMEDVVDDAERVDHRSIVGEDVRDTVVRDDDQGVDVRGELRRGGLGDPQPMRSLESERLGHDRDRQGALVPGVGRDDRCGAGSGTATKTGGDEDEVCAGDCVGDLGLVLLGCAPADLWVASGPEATGDGLADADLGPGARSTQGLGVGVADHEARPEPRVDHAIDGVAPAAADTDDPDRARLRRARMANPAGDGDQEAEG